MHFPTITLLFSATASLTFAFPLVSRTTSISGSPGFVTMKGFSNDGKVCSGKAPDGPTVRLPSAYMNGNAKCGGKVTVYYTPVNNAGPGLAPPATPTSAVATIFGTCESCKTWEAEASSDLFNMIDSGGDTVKGTWGPVIALGTY